MPIPKPTAITCLNDHRPVALTPVIRKCQKRLVLKYIIAAVLHRPNRPTKDTICTACHAVLLNPEHRGIYTWQLFVHYSSAFNTIIPADPFPRCPTWDTSRTFLIDPLQSVRRGHHCSSTLSLSTGAPQHRVLSPFLYTVHNCIPAQPTAPTPLLKF